MLDRITPLFQPKAKGIREGVVVGLGNHMVLVARDKLGASLQRLYSYGVEKAEGAIASFEKEVRYPGAVK